MPDKSRSAAAASLTALPSKSTQSQRRPTQKAREGSTPREDRTKLQLYCSERIAGELRELAAEQDVTLTELFRRSVSLYRFVIRNLREGKRLYVGTDESDLHEVLVL